MPHSNNLDIRDRLNVLRHKTALVRAASYSLRLVTDADVVNGIDQCCNEVEDELQSISDELGRANHQKPRLRVAG